MKDGRHQPIYTSKSVPETIVLCQIKRGNFTLCFLYNIAIWIFSLYWKFSLGKRTELAKKEKKRGKKKGGEKRGKNLDFFSFQNDLKIRRINLHKLFSKKWVLKSMESEWLKGLSDWANKINLGHSVFIWLSFAKVPPYLSWSKGCVRFLT